MSSGEASKSSNTGDDSNTSGAGGGGEESAGGGQQTSSGEKLVLPTSIRTETDERGIATGYKCDFHVQSETIGEENGVTKDSYYDLLYPCAVDPHDGITLTGAAVLQNIAEEFRILPQGDACVIPDTTLPLWMIGVSSEPGDEIIKDLPCQKLNGEADGEATCCVVVRAPMTFWWTDGDFSDEDILDVLSAHWNSPVANMDGDGGDKFRISYLGAVMQLKDGYDDGTQLPPAIPSITEAQTNRQIPPRQNSNFTVVGGFVLGGLLAVFIGAVFVLLRRRNRRRREDIEVSVIHKSASHDYGDGSDGPTLEVDVMSDDLHHPSSSGKGGYRNSFDIMMQQQEDIPTPSSYTFDLANSLKNDVMGTYGNSTGGGSSDNDPYSSMMSGPTSMAVVPPYPMDETSDSEVDSWAQTDGTVGSLEDRLEEITAEI